MPSQAPAATYKCPCKTKTKSCNRHMQRRQCEDRDREGVLGPQAQECQPPSPEAGKAGKNSSLESQTGCPAQYGLLNQFWRPE